MVQLCLPETKFNKWCGACTNYWQRQSGTAIDLPEELLVRNRKKMYLGGNTADENQAACVLGGRQTPNQHFPFLRFVIK